MKNILTITKKELRSYFVSPIAWVVFALFLVLSGFFFSTIFFLSKEASLRGTSYNMIITLLFLIPLICMRLFAEEKKLGTLEILMTKPVRDIEVVMGKFLSAVLLFAAMLATTFVYVIILIKFGTPDMGPIYTSYLGIFLCGLAFISLGVFASTLTENQIIAAVVSFAFILLFWILSWVSSQLSTGASEIISYLSISEHFDDFVKGIIDLKDVVYLLSFILFWIFLTIKSIEVRKWK